MFTFGLFFYGPYQHWWYSLLNQRWPLKTSSHFLTKVRPCLCKACNCVQFIWQGVCSTFHVIMSAAVANFNIM